MTERDEMACWVVIVSRQSVLNILLSCRLRCAKSRLKPRAVLSLATLTEFLLPSYLKQRPIWEVYNRQVSVNKPRYSTAKSANTPTQAEFYFPTLWGAMNRTINLLGHYNIQYKQRNQKSNLHYNFVEYLGNRTEHLNVQNLCQYHDLISEHAVKSSVKDTVFCDVGGAL
jgi:hypothetical protein